MSSILSNSLGFTPGAFSTLNTGIAGQGWGINTATFFEPVQNTVFNISHRGGIVIDLYSLILMNPFEKIDFLIDIPMNVTYFNITQSDNLIFICPKTNKILKDNLPDGLFNGQVICVKADGQTFNINFKVKFKRENLSGPNVYNLNYIDNVHKIPLSTFVKESSIDDSTLTQKFSIIAINGQVPSIDSASAIANGVVDLTKLSLGTDCSITLKYNDTTLGSRYEFKLNLANHIDGEQQETKIRDISVNITPIDGTIFDIKDHVSGDTRGLICTDMSTPQLLPFKFQVCGSLVGITPITEDAIAILVNKTYIKKMSYKTNNSQGVFNIIITLNTTNTYRDLVALKKLEPVAKHVLFTVTDNNFTNGEYFNFEALLGNRIFNDVIPVVSVTDTNIEVSQAGGANIRSTGAITTPHTINVKFSTNPGQYGLDPNITIYSSTISLISDDIPYKEPFDVSPIVFEVSKNYGPPKNLFDYISAPANYYKDLTFVDKGGKLFINTNTQIISIKQTEYENVNVTNHTFNGIIEVKHTSYVDTDTKDDLGNIIGLREIPYTINYISKPYNSNALEIPNIKIYSDSFESPLEFDSYRAGFVGYIDPLSVEVSTKIEVLENPSNTIPVLISKAGTSLDKTKINIVSNKLGFILILESNTMYYPPENSVLKLLIKYTNNLTVETVYEQNIFFLKKEI